MDSKMRNNSFDRENININEYYELEHWSKEFDVNIEQLKAAVKKVGNSLKKVKKYLDR